MNQEQRQRNGMRQALASVHSFLQRVGTRVLQVPGMRRLLAWLLSLINRLHWVLFESDFELLEVVLAIVLFGWAFVIGMPGMTFGPTTNLRNLAPYEALIALFLYTLFGCKVISAVFEWATMHAVTMLVISGWWTYIAVSIVISSRLSTGTPVYVACAVGQAWAFFRFVARHDLVPGHHER